MVFTELSFMTASACALNLGLFRMGIFCVFDLGFWGFGFALAVLVSLWALWCWVCVCLAFLFSSLFECYIPCFLNMFSLCFFSYLICYV